MNPPKTKHQAKACSGLPQSIANPLTQKKKVSQKNIVAKPNANFRTTKSK